RCLFLTATPNRTDELPIGIDKIAFSITYRELADLGVILMPEFESFPVQDFEWEPEAVAELAAQILGRAEHDFVNTLATGSTTEKVRGFYHAVRDALAGEPTHVLGLQDLGYIDSGGNSLNLPPAEFLDAWKAKPRGILISAQMLLEGFDDPL